MLKNLLIHQKGGSSRHFAGRIVRGRAVWPDRDIPYFDQEQLAAAGLTERYEKVLAAFEAGDGDAFWGDSLLMTYSFEAYDPLDRCDPRKIAIRGKL